MKTIKNKLNSPNIQQKNPKTVELKKQNLQIETEFNSFKKTKQTKILRQKTQLLKTIHNKIKTIVKRATDT